MKRVVFGLIVLLAAACTGAPESRVVFVTATPSTVPPQDATADVQSPIATADTADTVDTAATLTSGGLEFAESSQDTRIHTVVAGETLFAIAQQYETTMDTLVELNQLENPNLLFVGQELRVPGGPTLVTPSVLLLPSGSLVRGPTSPRQSVELTSRFAGYFAGLVEPVEERTATGDRTTRSLTAAQIVDRVAVETSVDPRVLLAFLEYRAGWITQSNPANVREPLVDIEESLPVNRTGLYRQVSWLANELNRGYYQHKYGDLSILELEGGIRLLIDPSLNSETVAILRALSLDRPAADWLADVSLSGWRATYTTLFGEPQSAGEVVWAQPGPLALPFARGETWLFTGGPHGGWGSGSAWSALDFAPPDESRDSLCFISEFPARAAADGVIAYRDAGTLILDLDGDGDERTGWNLLYLHLTTDSMPPLGMRVATGDALGYPSCEGGVSTATHLHIARRFNGEWVPADCSACTGGSAFSLVLGGWESTGLFGQEYQGRLVRGTDERVAEQTRTDPINRVTHE
ncbi:MAG: LysM peptidoglycan-binding domain-containing protein [Chloroflexi bacterium]|nr:LysM peptidoglycan-binding domain-containing protein [Chloroflexota bacterium]